MVEHLVQPIVIHDQITRLVALFWKVEARDVTDFEVRCAFAAREEGG